MAGRSIESKALARQPSSFLKGRWFRSTSSADRHVELGEREELAVAKPRQDPASGPGARPSPRGLCPGDETDVLEDCRSRSGGPCRHRSRSLRARSGTPA